jgi:uncharacterized membrane protein YhdT
MCIITITFSFSSILRLVSLHINLLTEWCRSAFLPQHEPTHVSFPSLSTSCTSIYLEITKCNILPFLFHISVGLSVF